MSEQSRLPVAEGEPPELKSIGYEIFIGFLSMLSILNLLLIFLADDPNLDTVILTMNGLFSAIFLGDFVFRLFTAASKSRYVFKQFGWADLLASLPLPEFKVLRIFRLVRVFRLLRENGVDKIGRSLIKDRAGSALFTLLLMGILVLEFGSLGILRLEKHATDPNITTASDGLWWVVVTISTVGYGDRFPVTNSGRTLGALVIVLGVGIFGTFTGYLANLFLAPKTSPEVAEPASVDDAQAKLRHLKHLMVEQQAAIEEIERLLQAGPG